MHAHDKIMMCVCLCVFVCAQWLVIVAVAQDSLRSDEHMEQSQTECREFSASARSHTAKFVMLAATRLTAP